MGEFVLPSFINKILTKEISLLTALLLLTLGVFYPIRFLKPLPYIFQKATILYGSQVPSTIREK